MSNPLMSSLILPVEVNGEIVEVTFEIKDAYARELIVGLGSPLYWMGVTTTQLADGCTTNPIVIPDKYELVEDTTGKNPHTEGWYVYDSTEETYVLTEDETPQAGVTYFTNKILAKVGGMAQYDAVEYVWSGTSWQLMGHGNFGALAFESSASGSFTPQGSVSVSKADDSTTTVNSITAVGTLPKFTTSGETVVFHPGTLPTKGADTTVVTASGAVSASFAGTAGTVTVS